MFLTVPAEEIADLRQIEWACVSVQPDLDQRGGERGEHRLLVRARRFNATLAHGEGIKRLDRRAINYSLP